MEINKGFYVQLTDRTYSRNIFSASTGNLNKEDFLVLWNLVGKKILERLSEDNIEYGHRLNFDVEASKLQ